MLSTNLSLILAAILLILAIVQMVRPFSGAPVNPVLLVIASLLLMARYAVVRQQRKRKELLDKVPRHPLGISDDPEP
jgi:hypothetical protein